MIPAWMATALEVWGAVSLTLCLVVGGVALAAVVYDRMQYGHWPGSDD